MVINTISEAKAQLSALIERVERGERIIIGRNGKPVAVLIAYEAERHPRTAGALKGKIHLAADFDEIPDDLAESVGLVRK